MVCGCTSKVTCVVSQFASPGELLLGVVMVCGCTSFLTTLPWYGAFGLNRFHGISLPSSSLTTFTPFFFTAAARRVTTEEPTAIAAAPRPTVAGMPAKELASGAVGRPARRRGADSGATAGGAATKVSDIDNGV